MRASSGKTTSSHPWPAAWCSRSSRRTTTSLRVSSRWTGPSWAAPTVTMRLTASCLPAPSPVRRLVAGQRNEHVEQDVGAGGEIGGVGVLVTLWLMPVDARHEDHPGRAHPGQHLGVVTGARRQPHRRVPEAGGGALHQVDDAVVERRPARSGRASGSSTEQPSAAADLVARAARSLSRPAAGRLRRRGGGRPSASPRPATTLTRSGSSPSTADGAHLRRTVVLDERADAGTDGHGDETGVAAQVHRGRAGVARSGPSTATSCPRDALDAGDGADGDAVGLEDRALLDVQLDVGVGHRVPGTAPSRGTRCGPARRRGGRRRCPPRRGPPRRSCRPRRRGCRACRGRTGRPPRRRTPPRRADVRW